MHFGKCAARSVILLAAFAAAVPSAWSAASDSSVPAEIARAARRWRVDLKDVVISVVPLDGARSPKEAAARKPRYALHADRADRPASTAKLVTTLVALEELGASWRWKTTFYAAGRPDAEGRLKGPLYLRGTGDPTLVVEDYALELRRLAAIGVKHIEGDLVIDRSAFNVPKFDSAAFDGRASRPYNLGPDATLLNYRNLALELIPDREAGVARISALPPLSGVRIPKEVKLTKGACGDWKTKLGYRIDALESGEKRVRFTGGLPAACGPKAFNVISFAPNEYAERMTRALWARDGRTWTGRVVEGRVPADAKPLLVRQSPSLSEVAELTNKWSNNIMARHIFLSLGAKRAADALERRPAPEKPSPWKAFPEGGTLEGSRRIVAEWLAARGIPAEKVYIENGSGLSRETRVTGRVMTQILAAGWAGPFMPEYLASLPISGMDGTMFRRRIARGEGRIKTGFLRDVRSVGGYVHARSGERYALYASVRGAKNMPGGIAFLDSVIDWVYKLPAAGKAKPSP